MNVVITALAYTLVALRPISAKASIGNNNKILAAGKWNAATADEITIIEARGTPAIPFDVINSMKKIYNLSVKEISIPNTCVMKIIAKLK